MIYLIEYKESTFLVIADNEEEAKAIVVQDYFDEQDVALKVLQERDLRKGIVVSHDSEDFYFN
jgi:hypothetical protein